MSVEIARGMLEVGQGPNSSTHRSPEQRIAESDEALETFANFMWRYVGHPSATERMKGKIPPLMREAEDGTRLNFTEVAYSGYSQLTSHLVHVRIDRSQTEAAKRFFVATGRLHPANLEERTVVDVRHILTPQHTLASTVLYLYDHETEGLEKDYWPQVKMSALEGYSYYPGGDHRQNRLHQIDQLHSAALGRVALVRS